jgi:glycosyltransferase involved in cell wall biosynthesis
MPLKVLMINNFHYLRGGDCRYTFDLASILEEHGHDVVHFAMHHPQNKPSEYSNYFVNHINYDQLSRQKNLKNALRVFKTSFWNLESQRKLSALLDEFKPDIAHLQNILHHITPSIIPILRKSNIPIVHHLHDYNLICPDVYLLNKGQICEKCFQSRYYRCAINRCKKDSFSASLLAAAQRYYHEIINAFRGVSCYISPSEFAMCKFHEADFFAKKLIVAVPHFVRCETFEPNRDFGKKVGAVFAGRLIAEKGLITLLKAAEMISDIPITLYGEGPLKSEIKKYVNEKGLSNIRMMGWCPQKDLFDAFRRARCVVMPSEWYETAGLSVFEAAAVGTAAVVSNNTAMAEFVEDGRNGLVFEMRNAESLAECIRKSCSNSDVSNSMGQRAIEHVKRVYTADVHYKRIMDIYQKVISSKSQSTIL